MTELNPASWIQNSGETNTAQLMRLGVGSLSAGLSSGITPRGGVHPSLGGALVVSAGTGLAVSVASGLILVPGNSDTVAQGAYVCANNGTVSISLQAADGSNPRIDLIVARVHDSFYDAGPDDEWELAVVTGTPAGSPAVPTPGFDNWMALAQVLVPASATVPSTITDVRQFLSSVGGILPVRNSSELPSTGEYHGMFAYQQDTDEAMVWDGSDWTLIANPTSPYGHVEYEQPAGTGDTAISGTSEPGTELLSQSVTLSNARRYRITGQARYYVSTAGTREVKQRIRVATTEVGVTTESIIGTTTSSTRTVTTQRQNYTPASSGAVTVDLYAYRFSGATTLFARSTPEIPTELLIEDIGAA